MLQRGVVTVADPNDGPDHLWSPTLAPRPVRFVLDPDAYRWGVQLPVVYDDATPDVAISLVNWPVPPGLTVPAPSGLELLCPSPSVADYAAQLDGTVEDPVLRAFALRMTQLTPYEAQRIARVADGVVTDELLDRVHRAGPGLEHTPEAAADALDHLPAEILGKRRRRLLHGMYVAVRRHRARGLKRATARVTVDDLDAVLAPFVAVCGAIPEIDVTPAPVEPEPVPTWTPPPVLRLWPLAPPSQWDSVVWIDLVGSAPPEDEVFAAIPSPATTFADVALGRNCTYHRMRVPTLDGGRYRVLLEPALPAWPADQLRLVPVDWCRHYVAQYRIVTTQPVAITHEPELLWRAATAEHTRIDQAYLSYEMSPVLSGQYPAITDISVPETAAFQEAFGHAGALRTECGPVDLAHAKAYYQAVNELSRRWTRCEERGRRGG